MPDAEVQLQPDSTGKPIDNTTVVTGAGTVYRQRISIADAATTNNAGVTAGGALKVDGSAVIQPISGTLTAISGPLPAGTNVIGHVIVDSGTLTTLPLPTGAATAAAQALQAKLTDVQPVTLATKIAGEDFTNDRMKVVGIDGIGNANQWAIDTTGALKVSGVIAPSVIVSRGFDVLHPRRGRLQRSGLHA